MRSPLREDAERMIRAAINANMPDSAVAQALAEKRFPGRVFLVAVGKAAWQMARAACQCLPGITQGIVITKYGHVMGELPGVTCYEAGHPVPDEASFRATQEAIRLVQGLQEEDTVLFLLSGGGSALFEKPLVPPEELQDVTRQLLACGADIMEINMIRKRLSAVKGGKFAALCAPARVYAIILSDILGDQADMIASGPTCADSTTCRQAVAVAEKYGLRLSKAAWALLRRETPKALANAEYVITGSVRLLCRAAVDACRQLGYEAVLLTDGLCCQAREAGAELAAIARAHAGEGRKLAFVVGGETVVTLTGHGLGGRNQELALAAAAGLDGLTNVAVISVGSDGTDGPTDAAGGFADGATAQALRDMGISVDGVLRENDSYHALEKTGGLIFTGPTGTNVNDVAIALILPE
ncbi:MAG: glycerate kinase [Clostridiales bacterium]|nr:glycerate kinase [Clostridiales bacterium]